MAFDQFHLGQNLASSRFPLLLFPVRLPKCSKRRQDVFCCVLTRVRVSWCPTSDAQCLLYSTECATGPANSSYSAWPWAGWPSRSACLLHTSLFSVSCFRPYYFRHCCFESPDQICIRPFRWPINWAGHLLDKTAAITVINQRATSRRRVKHRQDKHRGFTGRRQV